MAATIQCIEEDGTASVYADGKWRGRIYRVPGGWAQRPGGPPQRRMQAARRKAARDSLDNPHVTRVRVGSRKTKLASPVKRKPAKRKTPRRR